MPTPAQSLRILVVAPRELASDVRQLLVAAGFREPTLGDGGDDTLDVYNQLGPHIVLLGAHLERGDARSLVSAIKEGAHRHFVRVVLLGEADGPIRTALDASDFDVDRFLTAPLVAKTLSYVTRSCGSAALQDESEGPPAQEPAPSSQTSELPTREPTLAMVEVSESPFDPPVAGLPDETPSLPQREPTLIASRPSSSSLRPVVAGPTEATSPADRSVMDSSMDSSMDSLRTTPRTAFEPTELGPSGAISTTGDQGDQIISDAMDAAIAEFLNDAISAVGLIAGGSDEQTTDEVEREGAISAAVAVPLASPTEKTNKVSVPTEIAGSPVISPTRATREPTLILTRPPSSAEPSTASTSAALAADPDVSLSGVPIATAASITIKEAVPSTSAWQARAEVVGQQMFSDVDDELDGLDDDFADLDELEGNVIPNKTPTEAVPSETGSAGSGAIARELRQKMSAMAERLFPGRILPRRPGGNSEDAFSLPHDASTEIDFTSIESGQTGIIGRAPYGEMGRVETFAETKPVLNQSFTEYGVIASTHYSGQLGSGGEDIATLLARLHLAGFSGVAKFSSTDAVIEIHFDSGRPVFASSSLARDRMGDLLFREGKITRQQHADCRERVVASGRRMGELLVEMGFLKPRELLPAVRRHIEDIFYSVFAWVEGRYDVTEMDPPAERIRLSRHPAALVIEGVRRKYHWPNLSRALETDFSTADPVLTPTGDNSVGAIVELADLGGVCGEAVMLFDGIRGFSEVSSLSGLDLLTVAQLGYAFIALGAADIVWPADQNESETDSGRSSSALVGETDIAIDRQRVLAKFALVNDADYFMLLGVRRDASRFEIQRAYEAARRDFANDGFPDAVRTELADQIDTINLLIEEAYRILGDDPLRFAYLKHLS